MSRCPLWCPDNPQSTFWWIHRALWVCGSDTSRGQACAAGMYSSSHQIPDWGALELLCRGAVQHSLGARDVPGSRTGLTQKAQGFPGISLPMCGHSDHPAGAQDFCSAGSSARATGAAGCTNITQMEFLRGKWWCDQRNSDIRISDVNMREEELIIVILLFWITIPGHPSDGLVKLEGGYSIPAFWMSSLPPPNTANKGNSGYRTPHNSSVTNRK